MKKTLLLTAIGLILTLAVVPVTAQPFPEQVTYRGTAVDAAGQPLLGSHSMTFSYFGRDEDRLLVEVHDEVAVAAGGFTVELGTGKIIGGGRYETLQTAFAEHPEVALEVTIGDTVQSPRVGIQPSGHSLKSRLVAAGMGAADDEAHWKHFEGIGGGSAVQAAILAPAGSTSLPGPAPGQQWNPYLVEMEGPHLSVPVRDLPVIDTSVRPQVEDTEINPPRHEDLYDENGVRFGTGVPQIDDPLMGASMDPTGDPNPVISVEWEGIDNVNGVLPPDTEGAVGPNHYVQVVNLSFAVYSKTGTLLTGPSNTNTLWTGFGGSCETSNSGDPIFLYDSMADRWLFSQFANPGSTRTVCFAVSQTPDPTGAFFLYSVVTPRFPDYFKLGMWPDPAHNAYFMTTNSGSQGAYDVFAVDRANMLTGGLARPMQIFQNHPNLLMPADLDGPNLPPSGTPGLLYTFRKGGEPYFFNPPASSIDIYEFAVDWGTPANSTLTLAQVITPAQGLAEFNWTVCGFFVQQCLPQPGTGATLDSASWWPMQRLQYRNFGDTEGTANEAMVGTWTVDMLASGNRAAPRWFELRRSGGPWSIAQQGSHSPDADHRWMPSVSMDGAGNIGLGYSKVNGTDVFPSLYYSTWQVGDPAGVLRDESLMIAGGGAQTHSAARWGDYAAMDIDPVDDCTFWFTSEYIETTGSAPWQTRVAAFTVPGCADTDAIFADGFESGDTSAWTVTVP